MALEAAGEVETAVRGVGAGWVRTISRTYDLKAMTKALREALTFVATRPNRSTS